MFYVFVLVCLSCVVSFHFKEFICIILLLCCFFCDKTKWSSCLHLMVLLPFLFFCCFVLNFVFFFVVFIPLKKGPPPKPDTTKTKKSKNADKPDKKKNQLAQLCSQLVFLNFLGWA